MSSDKNEYEVFHNLLSGKQGETLSSDKVLACVQSKTLASLGTTKDLYVLHDFCDIRKPDATSMEHLGKVMSLEKNVINGYKTFNSVVVNVKEQMKS